MLYKEKCTGCGACKDYCARAFTLDCKKCGACASVCLHGAREQSGREADAAEIVRTVLRDLPFYKTSGGGITLSGGEPLLQKDAAKEILAACKAAGVNTAVETAGNVPWETFEALLPVTDLWLYDIKGTDEETHKKNTGADNRLILENARRLAESGAAVRFRMPCIPGYNDAEAPAVAAFAKALGFPLELMAYHSLGESKYAALGRACPTVGLAAPSKDGMKRLAEELGAVYKE